jgi:hypothetical protein
MQISSGFILFIAIAAGQAADRSGEDHPLVARYEGAAITSYRQPSLDEISVPVGKITDEEKATNLQAMEGRVTHLAYRVTPAVAALQIERHYTTTLTGDGFTPVFSCSGTVACGRGMAGLILNSGKVAPQGFADGVFTDRLRVLVARKNDTYVVLHMEEGPDRSLVYQAVIENAVLTTGAAGS